MTTSAEPATTTLKTLLDDWPHARGIKEGRIAPPGVRFDFVEIQPVNAGFHRMADLQEFDVSEMALTTYILARAHGRPITALPTVVNRGFHHKRLVYNVNSGIKAPKDLEGRRVGVRSYTQTTPLWVRGVLSGDYGVDLDKVQWVTFEPAHVRSYTPPANVVQMPEDKKLGAMLKAGEIDAAIGPAGLESDTVKQLIPDAGNAQDDWYRRTGIYPVNHVITVTDELVRTRPDLLRSLYESFQAAKAEYVEYLNGPGPFAKEDQTWLKNRDLVGGDPLPYGIEANRRPIEMAARLAHEQHIVDRVWPVEDLFLPEVLELAR